MSFDWVNHNVPAKVFMNDIETIDVIVKILDFRNPKQGWTEIVKLKLENNTGKMSFILRLLTMVILVLFYPMIPRQ